MGWGDEILAAGQAQRAYDADGSKRVAILGADMRPRWHAIWAGNPAIAAPEDVAAGEDVQTVVNGPNARPYIVYPFTKETGWTFNRAFRCREYLAKLYLTEAERVRGDTALSRIGPYVLIEPYTKHENFRWPMEKWTELVQACSDLVFLQHTHSESVPIPGVRIYEPATFREACGLLTKATAYVRSESGLCHAAAALGIPQVTLFGGCMDAEVMGGYPWQECIVDDDPETPCGSWKPCRHCSGAMARISVARVEAALRRAVEQSYALTRDLRTSESASPRHGRREQQRHRSQAAGSEQDRPEALRESR